MSTEQLIPHNSSALREPLNEKIGICYYESGLLKVEI